MSGFWLTEEQEAIREGVAKVMAGFDAEYWRNADETGRFPEEFVAAMAEGGWLGVAMPEEFGGSGLGLTEAAIVMQTVAQSGAAFTGASACLQVFGGHGYVREWGIEQIVRDARVAMIYEGTNEIQAIDLLVRKVLPDGGTALSALLSELAAELDDSPDAERTRQAMARFAQFTTEHLLPGTRAPGASPELPFWLADDYLRALAMLLMAWAWSRVGAAPGASSERWTHARTGFWRWVWPEFHTRMAIMDASLSAA